VSTNQQVDKSENNQADIPMQRIECRRFSERMGWSIIKEAQENGVSGFKVSAENRDVIQEFKEDAAQKKFDVLLVYMFDRIGRISSETPFIVEWFANNGIEVWSTQEGQQRFDNHVDRLTNYIRFWQGEGESRKTSARVKTKMRQMVEDGYFKGGTAAFGYKLVKSDRVNKKGVVLHNLTINEDEAEIVRLIFDQYVNHGLGKLTLSKYLTDRGIHNRKGDVFHPNSISRILRNPLYYGVMTCGDIQSPVLPHLQIISKELYDKAQQYANERTPNWDPYNRKNPYFMKGKALLSGNLFCGHCGGKMTLSTARYHGGDEKHVRYTCYQKNRGLRKCDGQTTYSTDKLDAIIEKILAQIFAQFHTMPKSAIIEKAYSNKLELAKSEIKKHRAEQEKIAKQIKGLEAEILKVVTGESAFNPTTLNSLLEASKNEYQQKESTICEWETELDRLNTKLFDIESEYKTFVNWGQAFKDADMEARRMICNRIFERIEIRRGYELSITLNIGLEQFGVCIDSFVEIA